MTDTRPARTAPAALPPTLPAWIAALTEGLLERELPGRLALLATLAGEHVLLIGPPGTAKSALARRLHRAFDGARWFERLLTRFSTPEELFGPLSLKALEHDRYERLTDGFLPTAGIAFLDEVFKANSAILNALLTLLNERAFDNGTERVRVPLVAVVAASNEVPTDEALAAFHDRFLLRVPVAPVGDDAFRALLALPPAAEQLPPELPPPITAADRAAVRAAAEQVTLGEDFIAGCTALRGWLAGRSAGLSDRRWRQFVGLCRTAAATEGRAVVDALDLWLVPFVANREPADVTALSDWFDTEVLALPQATAPWLDRAVQAFERQLQVEQSMPAEGGEDAAGKLALARAIGLGERDGDEGASMGAQRIVSQRLQDQLRRRFSPVHVAARDAQVAELQVQVDGDRAGLRARGDDLIAAMRGRPWLAPALVTRTAAAFAAAQATLDDLSLRLAVCRSGFAALPVDEAGAGGPPPAPAADGADARRATA